MQEIRHDLVNDPGKFELICVPISCYQKKDGSVPPGPKDGILRELFEKYPNLSAEMGRGIEFYGNCPAILSHIEGTEFPTKFATFPVAPSNLRAENPTSHVFNRLHGRCKNNALLPGWMLVPRTDIVEFAAIKLAEIMKFQHLTKVAIVFEAFTFDREDKNDYNRIKEIISRHVPRNLFMVSKPHDAPTGSIAGSVSSSVSYDD